MKLIVFSLALFAIASVYGREPQIKDFWKVYNDKTNLMAGCGTHAADLQNAWTEALELVDSALAFIHSVQEPQPKRLKKILPGGRAKRRIWDRNAALITTMFGVRISEKGGAVPEHVDYLKFIDNIFTDMQRGFNEGSEFLGKTPHMYCGINGWKYYKVTDPDPYDRSKKIYQVTSESTPDKGIWIRDHIYFEFGSKYKIDICANPSTLAQTTTDIPALTWCNHVWESNVAKKVQHNDVQVGVDLDLRSLNSIGVTFVHELAHLYGWHRGQLIRDFPAVKPNGEADPGKKTYGVGPTLNLAKNRIELASHTADAFALFALGSYLNEWDWSADGEAKEI
ncbi:MAG: hypothetical protein M1828_003690 [Chrysothrix sp. TS-e1954]|nr:MAG: hypothetical protein M1828_003690 [Chrysothrix sp. TS-e1954]